MIDAEPSLARELSEEELDDALAAIGEFAELKSPWMMGHAARRRRAVRRGDDEARPAGAGGGAAAPGLVCSRPRPAGCFERDLGQAGTAEPVRARACPLAPLPERADALVLALRWRRLARSPSSITSGWTAPAIRAACPASRSAPAARLLAAADVYQALTEPRPHRPARCREDAADERSRRGRAPGASTATRSTRCCAPPGTGCRAGASGRRGLTAREVEVLRLLARGLSNKEIAQQLVISPKTAGSHVEHIYAKTGASNRAQASLFARQARPARRRLSEYGERSGECPMTTRRRACLR